MISMGIHLCVFVRNCVWVLCPCVNTYVWVYECVYGDSMTTSSVKPCFPPSLRQDVMVFASEYMLA